MRQSRNGLILGLAILTVLLAVLPLAGHGIVHAGTLLPTFGPVQTIPPTSTASPASPIAALDVMPAPVETFRDSTTQVGAGAAGFEVGDLDNTVTNAPFGYYYLWFVGLESAHRTASYDSMLANFALRGDDGTVFQPLPSVPIDRPANLFYESFINNGTQNSGWIGFLVPARQGTFEVLWNEGGAIPWTPIARLTIIDGIPNVSYLPSEPTPTASPTPTATPPGPTSTPTSLPGPVTFYANVSDPAPVANEDETIYGHFYFQNMPVAGVSMTAVFHFFSGDVTCSSSTDVDGTAACTVNVGMARPLYTVFVDVTFTYLGQSYKTTTSFTPQFPRTTPSLTFANRPHIAYAD